MTRAPGAARRVRLSRLPRLPRVLDLAFALRPILWIPAIALFAAGESWGRARVAAVPAASHASALALGSLLWLLGAVHLANGWRDRAGDRANRKGRAVAWGAVSGRALATAGVACVGAAVLLALHPSLAPASRALLGVAGLLGAAYVAPGVELKRRAGLDLASHGAGYGVVAFLLGVSTTGAIGPTFAAWAPAVVAAGGFAAGILCVGLVTMIADAAGDAAVGQRTLAVALGERRAWPLARGFAWGAALLGLLVGEWIPALWGVLAAAALSFPDPEGADGPEHADAANRRAILLQVAFLALLAPRAPQALLAAAAIAAVTSAYGAWRWREGYPWNRLAPKSGGAGNRAGSGAVSARRACT